MTDTYEADPKLSPSGLNSNSRSLIIDHLPIRNVILLRLVSKYLHQATYDRSIWAHAYRTSSLLRPPGPFAWQTSQILESSLVQTTHLSLNWAPNPNATPVRLHTISIGEVDLQPFRLLCGRWLLVPKSYFSRGFRQIPCYDLDRAEQSASSSSEPYSILHECSETDASIRFFECDYTFISDRGTNGEAHCNLLAFLVVIERKPHVDNLQSKFH
ncbi:hypothetical protein BJ138DRAFT_5822 [Hygrophoropsis aurantiaca]|uniref:Uncharacterized protein n=1 Tax=Hygrophoropsis aurantiaca TaxID=72124 RepID=A0ACB8ATL9_9AGAM|nr:hypothetical protein BJ138DRAFT_5822 [Hygrophoropsis aurantiaca]